MAKRRDIISADDLRLIFRLVFKNLIYIVLIPVVMALIGYFNVYKINDVYQANAQIMIKSRETYEYQNPIYKTLGYYQAYEDINNQIRILRSYDFVKRSIEKLNFNVSYYIIGRLKTKELYDAMPFNVQLKPLNSGIYELPISIKILDMDHCQLVYTLNGSNYKKTIQFGKELVDEHFDLKIDRTLYLTPESIIYLKDNNYEFKVHTSDFLTRKYLSTLDIVNEENSTILNMSVQDEVVQRAVAFLDTLTKEYYAYSVQSEYAINERTIDYIDKQLDTVANFMDSIQNEMESYKSGKKILDLSKESETYYSSYIEKDQEIKELNYKINDLVELEEYLTSPEGERPIPSSIFILDKDQFLQKMITELYNLQIKRNQEAHTLTEKGNSATSMNKTIEKHKASILIYVKNTKKLIEGQRADIETLKTKYEVMIKGIPKSQRDILDIDRKLQVNEKLYTFLLEKRANSVTAKAGIIPQVSVLERARSAGIVYPKRSKTVITFLLIGLVMAAIFIFIKTLYFEKIENLRELQEVTNKKIIGGIGQVKNLVDENSLEVLNDPKSGITESFRNIRTSLQFFKVNGEVPRLMLFSSMHPGEGKTFVSTNMATLLANTGKKVLLIDFDLHKPKIHKVFGADKNSTSGLSSYLMDNTPINEIITYSRIENLHIIYSGIIPPSPSELMASSRTVELLQYAKDHYDYIILDTPPIGLITDAIHLMQFCDLSVFVVNTKFATKNVIKNLESLTDELDIKNMALVLNNIKIRRFQYYYNKYAYKYGYAYGYGYGSGYGYGYKYGEKKQER